MLIDALMCEHAETDFLLTRHEDARRHSREQSTVDKIDLSRVIKKLQFPTERGGQGWSLSETMEVVGNYRKFLQQHANNPKAELVPTEQVDEVWHLHILDTKRYHQDCQTMFGHYLHHLPNLEVKRCCLQGGTPCKCTCTEPHLAECKGKCSNCSVRCQGSCRTA
jgi:hypothetical protein